MACRCRLGRLRPTPTKSCGIESLQPHIKNGLIRLHPSQTTLIEQLRHFPKADHDDGPDALHMLWELASSGAGQTSGFISIPRRASSLDDDYPRASRRMI
ncbi:phage terminase large subunit [Dentiradicibacter hellwigii]|uniref:Phage terminase large subunit n=1 Tax=Dentiradicibacter hellwigii TaxID=3149053 RepID=A0ABV4UIQ4_9RHOO